LPDQVSRLSEDEKTGILQSAKAAAARSAIPLMMMTAIWVGSAFFYLRRMSAGPK